MWNQSLDELFLAGGPVMWPLLLCSVVGLAVVMERSVILLWRSISFKGLLAATERQVRAGAREAAERSLERSRSPVAQVGAAFLRSWSRPTAEREERVARMASQQLASLETRMSTLAMVATVAPLLGLLGTVTGLVDAFHVIELKEGQVQPGHLAKGIWEALLTTVFGLVIAVPAQVAFHALDRRIATINQQMEWFTSYLEEWLTDPKPGNRSPDRRDVVEPALTPAKR